MGLETFGDLRHKMNNVLGVVIPNGVNGDQVRKLMLEDFGIEIGTRLVRCTVKSGALAPWAITRVKTA